MMLCSVTTTLRLSLCEVKHVMLDDLSLLVFVQYMSCDKYIL